MGGEPATRVDDEYSAGMRLATSIASLDGPNVNPKCHTRLYTHGHRTERALVLLHGFTNCPQQFDALGEHFFELGWNVFIPRYPRHGYSDRLTESLAELRAEHLAALANRAAAAGAGLGERLTVAGLSLGGALTGLLAQEHEGIERAVLIAPMFGLQRVPGLAHPTLTWLAASLPNFYIWWDQGLKEKIEPDYGYPRFSTHAYAALLQTATRVLKAATTAAPKTRSIAVITNASEPGLDNRFTKQLADRWRQRGATVSAYEFPASDRLPHDMIDPANAAENTELVYPVVIKSILGDT
ncbi:MAG TPA: alpha/beta fold hydrolase [Candidatus Dormibacteraeota bacterium]|nr:alpha/beta fold hydrolase [Candidatus Dormibacteraeota bacterium]